MNVYDWDKTIYDGDTSIDFYKYNLKKDPRLARFWTRQLKAATAYKRGKITKTEMKTVFYEYFTAITDIERRVLEFWAEHKRKIKPWYLEQKEANDLVVSASPDFLLRPMTDELGIALIASDVDMKTGENLRPNCYHEEKVVRVKELYDIHTMNEFYSDSYSDDPLAQYAKRSFLVKGNERLDW